MVIQARWGLAACLMLTGAARAAVFSLAATSVNGNQISPTNDIEVEPEAVVEAHILLSNWGADLPQGVRTYQATVLATAGFNGQVLPLGWLAPPCGNCTSSDDCGGTKCSTCMAGSCVVAGHDPSQGQAIETTRPDYLFFGQAAFVEVDDSTLSYRFTSARDEGGALDTGEARYCGTLRLRVSEYACGSFAIGFVASRSYISDPSPKPVVVPTASVPLILHVSPCKPLPTCTPDHCTIDPRMPHDPGNPLIPLNGKFVVMAFDRDMSGATSADFEVSSAPAVDPQPVLASVASSGESVTILFEPRLVPGQWTCVRHLSSGRRCCQASLPADVDWSRVSEPSDVDEVLDNLLGVIQPALSPARCDLDRSATCGPADLLTSVDLLTGAGAFVPYSGSTVPACPSATGP